MELMRSQMTGLLTDGFFDHLSGTVGENTVCPFTGVHVNGTQQLVQKHSSHIQIRHLPITNNSHKAPRVRRCRSLLSVWHCCACELQFKVQDRCIYFSMTKTKKIPKKCRVPAGF